jgi:hypothetical protein
MLSRVVTEGSLPEPRSEGNQLRRDGVDPVNPPAGEPGSERAFCVPERIHIRVTLVGAIALVPGTRFWSTLVRDERQIGRSGGELDHPSP